MDKLAYLAMSSAAQDKLMESSLENNLANVNTVGYKSDEVSFKSLYMSGSGSPVRVYGKASPSGVNLMQGPIDETGQPLDVALQGNAWLSVTKQNGDQGYIHSASLHVNSNGILVTQNGDTVNSENGFSITVPQNAELSIDKKGEINTIINGQLSVIDKLKVSSIPSAYAYKDQNGLINVDSQHAGEVKSAQGDVILSGALEGSNASAVDTLVRMIDLSRQYEADINQISTAKKDDSAANNLLNVR